MLAVDPTRRLPAHPADIGGTQGRTAGDIRRASRTGAALGMPWPVTEPSTSNVHASVSTSTDSARASMDMLGEHGA
ncbi:hypothetical protein CFP66_17660 [Pseudonocardia sp. MH-G8]|nr:hypothetical protein CFP66_17660 [Pseudonocardia sp. MH-G8]